VLGALEQPQLRLDLQRGALWTRPFQTLGDVDTLVPLRFLERQPHGRVVQHARVSAATAYRQLLRELQLKLTPRQAWKQGYETQEVQAIRRIDPAIYRRGKDVLAPLSRVWDMTDWPGSLFGVQWTRVTPAVRDGSLREVRLFRAGPSSPREPPPTLRAVGTFDPDRLGAAPEPGAPPLSTMQPPLLTARDDATAARLHARPLRPNGNLAGYIAQPPALITTLAGARAFSDYLYVAVIATILLGVAAVVDVPFLGLRERAAELATLEASGWDDRALGRLVALEGLWIGALGALAGAGLGLAGAALFAGALPAALVLTSLAAAAAGTLLAGAAALVPALRLRSAPTVPMLAGE
jgi:hypothetical protein